MLLVVCGSSRMQTASGQRTQMQQLRQQQAEFRVLPHTRGLPNSLAVHVLQQQLQALAAKHVLRVRCC